jgi:hypothetical protein
MRSILGHKTLLLTIGMMVALTCAGWWLRTPVLSYYALRDVNVVDDDGRAAWVNRVVALDWAVVPGLLDKLHTKNPTVCSNVEAGLVALIQCWGPEDARTLAVAEEVHRRFAGWTPLGQITGLQVMTAMLNQDGPATWPVALMRTAGDLLHASRDRPELRGPALILAVALLDHATPGQWLDISRIHAEQGLSDRFPRTRLAAVQLVMRSPLQSEPALLAKVVPMLRDETAAIRRAALVTLVPARDLVSEDDLLPLLHDPNLEIRQLCDAALRSRGLSDVQLALARDISDENPRARLRVIDRIGRARDLDNPATWLRRLSQDPCSAVRAAAIRAAAQNPQVDLGDRLREMAEQDPSETVRQNAQHFLSQRSRDKD